MRLVIGPVVPSPTWSLSTLRTGVTSVAAAIRNHLGAVVGAVSAAAPTSRANEAHLARMRDSVMCAARALSAEFGEEGQHVAPREEPQRP